MSVARSVRFSKNAERIMERRGVSEELANSIIAKPNREYESGSGIVIAERDVADHRVRIVYKPGVAEDHRHTDDTRHPETGAEVINAMVLPVRVYTKGEGNVDDVLSPPDLSRSDVSLSSGP